VFDKQVAEYLETFAAECNYSPNEDTSVEYNTIIERREKLWYGLSTVQKDVANAYVDVIFGDWL
jgi:hypothetical protein